MIVGLGSDLLDVARVEQKLREDSGLTQSLFTPLEIRYCEGKHHPARHYAARFAAKEALLKALGTGWRDGLSWREIEIRNDELGRPVMVLSGLALTIAIAWVSMLGKEGTFRLACPYCATPNEVYQSRRAFSCDICGRPVTVTENGEPIAAEPIDATARF